MAKIDFGGDYKLQAYESVTYATPGGFMDLARQILRRDGRLTEFSLWDAESLELLAKRIRESYSEPLI